MSHEVVFLPHILGQTWAQALAAARTAAREEDPRIVAARLEPWPDLVLHAAQILGQIEEYRGRGQRELLHPVTRLRFTFFGEDGVIALPYWYDGPVARMAATMAFRFAHAVEADTGLAAYDPQQRTPLAEMGLEKFIAGYLRGREKALEQEQARGPVPVGHALPTGRSASRRELGAGPSARGGKAAPRQDSDARAGGDSGRPRPGEKVVRGEAAVGGRGAARPTEDRRPAADSGPAAGLGRLRRGGKPARGEQAERAGKVAEPRKAPRRGEPDAQRSRRVAEPNAPRRGDAGQAPRRGEPAGADAQRPGREPKPQRSGKVAQPRKPSRRERAEAERARRAQPPPPGAEWVPRPGRPEQRGVPADPGRTKRSEQGQRGERSRGELRRVGEPPEPRRAPRPGEEAGGRDPGARRKPPELPKGRY